MTRLLKQRESPLRQAAELPFFRFGMRQLLAFVTALCLLLTVVVLAQGVALVVLLAAAVVTAHITGTALGSRLRAHADWRHTTGGPTNVGDWAERSATADRQRSKCPFWHGRGSASTTWLTRLVILGVAVGGVGGGVLILSTMGPRVSVMGLVVVTIALAVLGGWFAFLLSNFVAIFRHGFLEAVADSAPDAAGAAQAAGVAKETLIDSSL